MADTATRRQTWFGEAPGDLGRFDLRDSPPKNWVCEQPSQADHWLHSQGWPQPNEEPVTIFKSLSIFCY